jgi:hypothetical protein
MFDNYVIEVRSSFGFTVQAGIVVRDEGGFRFYAATRAFDALEGRVFKNPKSAEQAARDCIAAVTASRHFSPAVAALGILA